MKYLTKTSLNNKLKAGVCTIALAGVLGLGALTLTPSVAYSNESAKKVTTEQELKDNVTKDTSKKTEEKRKEVISEALSALQEASNALKALDENKPKDAIKALERATGKLDIVLARDPNVALIPVGVSSTAQDLIATPEMAEKAVKEVKKLLDKGEIQAARALLSNLASEVAIKVTSLPMATYPAAMKEAAALIDKGDIETAKEVLQVALNTLDVHVTIIPIPVTNAQMLLEKAKPLAETKDRDPAKDMELKDLLNAAEQEIKLAEALGYGRKDDFENFYKEINMIKEKTSNNKHATGLFDKIVGYMKSITQHSGNEKSEDAKNSQ